jgi:hypothetical protein
VQEATQMDMIRMVGEPNYLFPMKERGHIVSALAVNITEAMIQVLVEPQPNTTFTMLQYVDIIYLHNTNKDKNTSWPFSDISFDIAPGFSWFDESADSTAIRVTEEWLNRLFDAARSTSSVVGAYLNYIDPYMDNWQTLYYRHHWDRLRDIVGRWDPGWYFRFPQGIPPRVKSTPPSSSSSMRHTLASVFVLSVALFLCTLSM